MEFLGIGLQLTVFGMGLVFLLLAAMACIIALLLRMDHAQPAQEKKPAVERYPSGLDQEAISAILTAVLTHQAVKRKEAAPAMRKHQPGTLPSRWVSIGRTLQNNSWHPSRRVS